MAQGTVQIRIVQPPQYSIAGQYPTWVALAEFPHFGNGGEVVWSPIKVEGFGRTADALNALCLEVGSAAMVVAELKTRIVQRDNRPKQTYVDLQVVQAIARLESTAAPPQPQRSDSPAPRAQPKAQPMPIAPTAPAETEDALDLEEIPF